MATQVHFTKKELSQMKITKASREKELDRMWLTASRKAITESKARQKSLAANTKKETSQKKKEMPSWEERQRIFSQNLNDNLAKKYPKPQVNQ